MEPEKNKDLKEKMAAGLLQLKKTGKKDEPSEWKSERIRAERRARLAEMKSKEGGKKPIRTRSRAGRIISIIVAVALLLGILGWGLLRFGVPQRMLTAVTIGDQAISAAELNMVMGLHAMSTFQMGLMYVPENQAVLKDVAPGSDHTYLDILADSAISELKTNKILLKQLKADGFEMSEDAKAALEQQVTSLPMQFAQSAQQSGVTLPIFLESSFGPGAKMEDLENYLRESYTVQEYLTTHYNNVAVSDEEMEAAYDTNKNQYDMVNYYVTEFLASFPEDADDAAKQAARDGAAARAEDMVDALDGPDNFYDLAFEMGDSAQKEALQRNPGSVHHVFATYNDNETPGAIRTWLFDEARTEGEIAVVPGVNSSYVVLFESRQRADLLPYTVRHILIKADRDTAPIAEIEAAKEKADGILKEYEDGDKTETSFAELAKTYSEDGNAAEGGIYADISPDYMVSEFENWAMDPARKAGDTTIVQSRFGFHIMYFVSHGDTPYWKSVAKNAVANDETIAWRNEIVGEDAVSGHSLGLKLVGKSGLSDILFGRSYDAGAHSH